MLFLTGVSCKKNDHETGSMQGPTDLNTLAQSVKGEVFSGNLEQVEDREGIAFLCKSSNKLLAMEKSSGIAGTPGNIQDAQVMCSSFGFIIRDTHENKIWTYVTQDEESREEFKSVMSRMRETPVSSTIPGYVRININLSDY